MSTESYLVGRREAARLLGCSTKTIDRLCARGELRKVPIGGRAMIERASITAYVDRLCGRAQAPPAAPQDRWGGWLPELVRDANASSNVEAGEAA
jgi:excisionase family DNA binding protein